MTVDEMLAMEEIKQLRSKYSHCYDANDLDGLVELFTDDAICEWDQAHGGAWVGKQAIRENYAHYFELFGRRAWIVLHAVTNPWIEITSPNTAEGRWFMLDFNFCGLTEDPLGCIGIYDDLYHRVNGVWKIHRTRLDFLYPDRNITGGIPGKRIPCALDENAGARPEPPGVDGGCRP